MCSQHLSYIKLSFYLSAFFFTHLHFQLVSFAASTLWLTSSAHIFNLLSDIRSASSMLEHLVMKALHYALLHLCAQIVFTFILFSFNLWPTWNQKIVTALLMALHRRYFHINTAPCNWPRTHFISLAPPPSLLPPPSLCLSLFSTPESWVLSCISDASRCCVAWEKSQQIYGIFPIVRTRLELALVALSFSFSLLSVSPSLSLSGNSLKILACWKS